MSNRYAASLQLKTKNTNRLYISSTIYPKIEPNDNDLYVISESRDRLDILANKYYNDKGLWWIIAVANNLNDASLSIKPGLQLRIPTNIGKILNDLDKVNI